MIYQTEKMIEGNKARYSPCWFYVWDGYIYPKMRLDTALDRAFKNRAIDVVKGEFALNSEILKRLDYERNKD